MPKEGQKIKVKALSGKTYTYVWTANPASGAMKEVYFAPDKSYVVAFFRKPLDANGLDRLKNLVGTYRESIFSAAGGDYWQRVYCWPNDLIQDGERVGLVVPAYPKDFFFKYKGQKNDLKGVTKVGKWFTSPDLHFSHLDAREVGDWRSFFNISLLVARAIRRLHLAGLAHSDLSYNNVLIDPVTSSAAIIDIDGLVVPGKYPPDVIGTPDFIAPEVYETMHLDNGNPKRKVPCQATDRHALAVLIYMYLLCRHPLRGRQICDLEDPQLDERLSMGEQALFIENTRNRANRYDERWVKDNYTKDKWPNLLPWMNLDKLPYTVCGPHLKPLFDRAFIEGLHAPEKRPAAFEWEEALIQTLDLLIPCENAKCPQKWFVFDNAANRPRCPFCGTPYTHPLPVLNFYTRSANVYRPTGARVMVYNGTRLYPWHSDPHLARNEKLTDAQKRPVACFQFNRGQWYLRNEGSETMSLLKTHQDIPPKSAILLQEGVQIRLGGENARMIHVQIVNAATPHK